MFKRVPSKQKQQREATETFMQTNEKLIKPQNHVMKTAIIPCESLTYNIEYKRIVTNIVKKI